MEELELSTRAYLDGKDYPPKVVKYPYAFNLFSHNTAIDMATGYNDEESKVIKETKKIFEDDRIAGVGHLHPRAGFARPFRVHDI
jgi:aspartate-semialdehyde dehydrogenase